MHEPLGYHVFTSRNGGQWLSEDEHSWTSRYYEAASFTSFDVAKSIGERESNDSLNFDFYVLACMPS